MSDPIDSVESLIQKELRASAPHGPRPEPPPGIYLQLYRGAMHGGRPELTGYVDRIAELGLPGVIFHGFPRELLGQWPSLAKLAQDRGLLALAAWGLDGSKDNDGTRLTPAEKGDLVGRVLARPDCAGGLLDAEGQWDSDTGPADDMDEPGALELCRALRARAPSAWVGDQPWYAIDSHGSVRRTRKPIDQGGCFAGFPVDEFATAVTWGRFRQAYIYRTTGGPGYAATFARMDREWATVSPALAAAGLERPLRVTLQAYRWLLHEQVHAILDRGVRVSAPVVLWCSPWPDAVALAAIRAVLWLQREGHASPGVDAREAVRRAQRALGGGLVVDGWWREKTAARAGLQPDGATTS